MPDAGSTVPASGTRAFGDRLAAMVGARESQVVLGLDPDPERLWPLGDAPLADARAALPGGATADADPRTDTAAAVLAHCTALVDAAGPACVAAKPQLACFERLGAPGWAALERVCAHARDAGLVVLADGKRGDVPVSARAYGDALFAGLGADAATVSPLLGRDALAPLLDGARTRRAGLFVLVRTSNPGASDVLDAELASGEPLWALLARLVAELGEVGESGIADVGAVCGATVPEHLARLRELMPATPFLLPGIGAQGGGVAGVAAAFAPGRAGGLVSASRSIAGAYEATGDDPAAAARKEAERLREQAWALA